MIAKTRTKDFNFMFISRRYKYLFNCNDWYEEQFIDDR